MRTSPTQPLFNKGDKCYYKYTLHTVKETIGHRITELNDGMFSCSCYDFSDECFQVDTAIEEISLFVTNIHRIIFDINLNQLNYPDIANYLEGKWIEMCLNKYDCEKLKILYSDLEHFSSDILCKINDLKFASVNGIQLFKNF